MPAVPSDVPWMKDSKLAAVVSSLVIDKRAGVLISDEELAHLIGLSTGRLNEVATDRRIEKVACASQPIEFTADIKLSLPRCGTGASTDDDSQVTDVSGDIKRRGGRRHGMGYYGLASAQSLILAAADLKGANTSGLADIVTRAFGIATDQIDTNPYRKTQRDLSVESARATIDHDFAEGEFKRWSQTYESLVDESDEIKPGVIVDYDAAGNVVGLEILDASKRVENPAAMEFAVRAA